ncbi:unnamed protein product [Prunus armeniaca]|uniref:Uncharacterized protein n=1 Tax=Prunus armeniaca TaxID=36596 RepID=A0A6J5XKC8_PRUAR|nr:unnamed protein product [Prunus armeniaca]
MLVVVLPCTTQELAWPAAWSPFPWSTPLASPHAVFVAPPPPCSSRPLVTRHGALMFFIPPQPGRVPNQLFSCASSLSFWQCLGPRSKALQTTAAPQPQEPLCRSPTRRPFHSAMPVSAPGPISTSCQFPSTSRDYSPYFFFFILFFGGGGAQSSATLSAFPYPSAPHDYRPSRRRAGCSLQSSPPHRTDPSLSLSILFRLLYSALTFLALDRISPPPVVAPDCTDSVSQVAALVAVGRALTIARATKMLARRTQPSA